MFSFGPLKGRVHPAGWPIITIAGLLMLACFWVSPALGWIGFFCCLGCTAFFREPLRVIPKTTGVLVSPADGLLVGIEKATPPKELGGYCEGNWQRLSIFLSVFDVHTTRMPEAGQVLIVSYHKGKFLNASLDKASEHNERNSVVLETRNGPLIITQIAGLIARRIQCDVGMGDIVQRGQTFGIIKFGSRVDLYVPASAKIPVLVGQRMVAGETVVALLA